MKFTRGFEVWHTDGHDLGRPDPDYEPMAAGWYYWFDADAAPTGPFATLGQVVTAAETVTKLYYDALAAEAGPDETTNEPFGWCTT